MLFDLVDHFVLLDPTLLFFEVCEFSSNSKVIIQFKSKFHDAPNVRSVTSLICRMRCNRCVPTLYSHRSSPLLICIHPIVPLMSIRTAIAHTIEREVTLIEPRYPARLLLRNFRQGFPHHVVPEDVHGRFAIGR